MLFFCAEVGITHFGHVCSGGKVAPPPLQVAPPLHDHRGGVSEHYPGRTGGPIWELPCWLNKSGLAGIWESYGVSETMGPITCVEDSEAEDMIHGLSLDPMIIAYQPRGLVTVAKIAQHQRILAILFKKILLPSAPGWPLLVFSGRHLGGGGSSPPKNPIFREKTNKSPPTWWGEMGHTFSNAMGL